MGNALSGTMPYRCDLNTGQQIYLDNQGEKNF